MSVSTGAEKLLVAEGEVIFDVYWSTQVGQTRKLTIPKIDEIKYVETNWG